MKTFEDLLLSLFGFLKDKGPENYKVLKEMEFAKTGPSSWEMIKINSGMVATISSSKSNNHGNYKITEPDSNTISLRNLIDKLYPRKKPVHIYDFNVSYPDTVYILMGRQGIEKKIETLVFLGANVGEMLHGVTDDFIILKNLSHKLLLNHCIDLGAKIMHAVESEGAIALIPLSYYPISIVHLNFLKLYNEPSNLFIFYPSDDEKLELIKTTGRIELSFLNFHFDLADIEIKRREQNVTSQRITVPVKISERQVEDIGNTDADAIIYRLNRENFLKLADIIYNYSQFQKDFASFLFIDNDFIADRKINGDGTYYLKLEMVPVISYLEYIARKLEKLIQETGILTDGFVNYYRRDEMDRILTFLTDKLKNEIPLIVRVLFDIHQGRGALDLVQKKLMDLAEKVNIDEGSVNREFSIYYLKNPLADILENRFRIRRNSDIAYLRIAKNENIQVYLQANLKLIPDLSEENVIKAVTSMLASGKNWPGILNESDRAQMLKEFNIQFGGNINIDEDASENGEIERTKIISWKHEAVKNYLNEKRSVFLISKFYGKLIVELLDSSGFISLKDTEAKFVLAEISAFTSQNIKEQRRLIHLGYEKYINEVLEKPVVDYMERWFKDYDSKYKSLTGRMEMLDAGLTKAAIEDNDIKFVNDLTESLKKYKNTIIEYLAVFKNAYDSHTETLSGLHLAIPSGKRKTTEIQKIEKLPGQIKQALQTAAESFAIAETESLVNQLEKGIDHFTSEVKVNSNKAVLKDLRRIANEFHKIKSDYENSVGNSKKSFFDKILNRL